MPCKMVRRAGRGAHNHRSGTGTGPAATSVMGDQPFAATALGGVAAAWP
jgi:hypothetical protein